MQFIVVLFLLLLAEIFTHRCGDKLLPDEKH